jgi:hypothetical protein
MLICLRTCAVEHRLHFKRDVSVDKSRQAHSEPTATAPRRKRAVTERLHVFPPDPQRPAAAAAAPPGPAARKPLRVTALLPLRSTRDKNASLDDSWGETPARPAQGTAPSVARPAPLPVPAPKVTPVAERPLAPIAKLTPRQVAPIAKPVAPIAKPVAPIAKLAPVPRQSAPISVPAPKVQASPLKPLARPAVGSNPPPVSDKPLPSLLSVIDRPKATAPMTSVRSRLPGLPPPAPARPLIGKTTAAASVVAASLTASPMAIASSRQTGPQSRVPAPAEVLLDDEIEELDLEPDLPEAANGPEVAQMLAFAKTASMAVPPPFSVRVESSSVSARPIPDTVQMAAQQFSDAEAAFFAAGDELDTVDMMPDDVFDDLPAIDRPGFWSRLKSRANAR